jgi:hypothetical protein
MHDTSRNGFVWASFYSLLLTQVAYPLTQVVYPLTQEAYPLTQVAYPLTLVAYPLTQVAYPLTQVAYTLTQVAIFYQVRSLLNGLCLLDVDNLVSTDVW